VETDLGVTVSIVTMLEGLSLEEIAGKLVEQLGGGERNGDDHHGGRNGTHHAPRAEASSNGCSTGGRTTSPALVDDLGGYSESELDEMIEDLIGFEDGFDGPTEAN
jgi:hypothetical protein